MLYTGTASQITASTVAVAAAGSRSASSPHNTHWW